MRSGVDRVLEGSPVDTTATAVNAPSNRPGDPARGARRHSSRPRTVLLHTHGLVERHGQSLDEGPTRLLAVRLRIPIRP